MAIRPLLLTTWTAIRRQARASELAFILIAVGTGAIAGLASAAIGALAHMVQRWLFALPPTLRLSGLTTLSWSSLLALPAGGALLAAFSWASRSRTRRLVDIVEANALHGGRMSLPDSLIISVQTVISNGFGASVGLEAAYAQAGGALASFAGKDAQPAAGGHADARGGRGWGRDRRRVRRAADRCVLRLRDRHRRLYAGVGRAGRGSRAGRDIRRPALRDAALSDPGSDERRGRDASLSDLCRSGGDLRAHRYRDDARGGAGRVDDAVGACPHVDAARHRRRGADSARAVIAAGALRRARRASRRPDARHVAWLHCGRVRGQERGLDRLAGLRFSRWPVLRVAVPGHAGRPSVCRAAATGDGLSGSRSL